MNLIAPIADLLHGPTRLHSSSSGSGSGFLRASKVHMLLVPLVLVALAVVPLSVFGGDDDSEMLSEATFNRLERIYDALDEEDWDEARDRIENLLERVRNDFEKAVVLQVSGNVYLEQGEYDQGRDELIRAHELGKLPSEQTARLLDNVFTVHAMQEDFEGAIEWGEKYIEFARDVEDYSIDTNRFTLMAQAHMELERFRDGLPWIKEAIDRADEPEERDYRIWLALHFELEEYREAAEVLERMVGHWPDNMQYWSNLYSIYFELDDEESALDTLAVAHRKGLFENEDHYLHLYRLYLFQDVPYEAGRILQEGLDNGTVERTVENMQRLSRAWLSAREWDEARNALEQQGELEGSGEPFFTIAQIEQQRGNWEQAAEAAERSYELGDFDRPYRALMVLGLSHFNMGNHDESLAVFERAREYEEAEERASEWIEIVDEERRILAGN